MLIWLKPRLDDGGDERLPVPQQIGLGRRVTPLGDVRRGDEAVFLWVNRVYLFSKKR
jgi:hypothetical protein